MGKRELTLEQQLERLREEYKTHRQESRNHSAYKNNKQATQVMLDQIARLESLIEGKV